MHLNLRKFNFYHFKLWYSHFNTYLEPFIYGTVDDRGFGAFTSGPTFGLKISRIRFWNCCGKRLQFHQISSEYYIIFNTGTVRQWLLTEGMWWVPLQTTVELHIVYFSKYHQLLHRQLPGECKTLNLLRESLWNRSYSK